MTTILAAITPVIAIITIALVTAMILQRTTTLTVRTTAVICQSHLVTTKTMNTSLMWMSQPCVMTTTDIMIAIAATTAITLLTIATRIVMTVKLVVLQSAPQVA